jgi:ankyrin repeat protein
VIVVERIDLAQARKRAKELVRAWRDAGREDLKLADAQREIAGGLGFRSWTALVRHAEAEAVAREERHARFVDWAVERRADRAQALLDLDPDLARAGLDCALLLGDTGAVGQALAADREPPRAEVGLRGWPPLSYVCHSAFLGGERTGDLVACAELLLDAGADPDSSFPHPEFGPQSALYGAAGVAHEPRMTALLLERGANPDDDESVYHACETRDHTCLRLLLDAGAKVEGTNAVAHMLDYDDLEGLRLLLEHDPGSEVHRIRWALGRERSRAHIELLLEHGAQPGPGDATLAVRRGRPDVAALLGEARPSPEDELIGAIRRADRDGVRAVLDAHPGLLDRIGPDEHDVIVHVAMHGDGEALKLALDLGFPIDIKGSEFNETALHAAAFYGRAGIVSLLLERGADPGIEAGEPFGGTPLDWAAYGSRHADPDPHADYVGTVERLLAAGASISSDSYLDEASEEVAPLLLDA